MIIFYIKFLKLILMNFINSIKNNSRQLFVITKTNIYLEKKFEKVSEEIFKHLTL